MSQNYYGTNPFGLMRGVSENSNYSMGGIGYPLQPNTMLLNNNIITPPVSHMNPPLFYTNLDKGVSLTSLVSSSCSKPQYEKEFWSVGESEKGGSNWTQNLNFSTESFEPKALWNIGQEASSQNFTKSAEILSVDNTSSNPSQKKRGSVNDSKKRIKSLSELTKIFMKIYGKQTDIIIPLDKWTTQLNTEKRRVYDIMNIFEGFGAVSRKAKNLYTWKGLQQICVALDIIQDRWNVIASSQLNSSASSDDDEYIWDILRQYNFERAKSLGLLCESFICLFLLWKPVITLEEAATKIPKILNNESKLKTKVRRLYDIANVLCVLKVIKKTLLNNGKPAFQWNGKSGIEDFCKEIEDDCFNEHDSSILLVNSASQMRKISADQTQVISINNTSMLGMGGLQNLPSINLDKSVSNLPLGLNENSLDLLEGIVKVLRKRLHESSQPINTYPYV